MTLHTLLAHLTGTEQDGPVLAVAGALARRFGSHVTALHVRPDRRDVLPIIGPRVPSAMYQRLVEENELQGQAAQAKARQSFDAWREAAAIPLADAPLGAAGPSAAWVDVEGREAEQLGERGRLFDLVVLGRPARDLSPPTQMALEAALFDAGRPVLMVPPAGSLDLPSTAAILAWNGSVQAARAMFAAMPLLAQCRETLVFAAEEPGRPAGRSADLVQALSWHGIKAGRSETRLESDRVGPGLLAEAGRIGAGLLVMGAYSHSRTRQMILGGATRHVIANAAMPVLLCH